MTSAIKTTFPPKVVSAIIYDKDSGTAVDMSPMTTFDKPIDPGKSVNFDMPTKFNETQRDQLNHVNVAFVT